MGLKKIIHTVSRVILALLNEIYWLIATIASFYLMAALFGTFSDSLVAVMLVIYIIFVGLFNFFIYKRVVRFLKEKYKLPPAE